MSRAIWRIVLAAGLSQRMGSPKPLLQLDGESMIQRIVRIAGTSGRVAVVCGAEERAIRRELAVFPDTVILSNPQAAEGMSTSLHAAVRFLNEQDAQAVIFLLGDQPGIEPGVIAQVEESYRLFKPCRIVQASYTDHKGHPVLIDRSLFAELLDVTGDEGARSVLSRHWAETLWVGVPSEAPPDLDTPTQYADYLRKMSFIGSEKG